MKMKVRSWWFITNYKGAMVPNKAAGYGKMQCP
jgi:hypothetical protein